MRRPARHRHAVGYPVPIVARGPLAGPSHTLSRGTPLSAGAALAAASDCLRGAGVPSARREALLLLCAILNATSAALLAHPERALGPKPAARYAELVARRAAREPLAYIVGRREFYGRDFEVSPAVLVPRPESELILELLLEFARSREFAPAIAADVGSGSGVLAVTVAAELPGIRLVATDISAPALGFVRTNAARHAVADRVQPVRCDLLSAVAPGLDAIVANLPYLPSATIAGLEPEVAHYEPRIALDGGPDGTRLIRRLLPQAASRLKPGRLLLVEIDPDQASAVRRAAKQHFPAADIDVVRDPAGRDRVLRVRPR
jgi:release factor glutamine methyltransferase